MARFVLAVCLLLMTVIIFSSRFDMNSFTFTDKPRVIGSGKRVDLTHAVSDFEKVESAIGGSEVKVTFGETNSCKIIADDNIQPLLIVSEKDQTLSLRCDSSFQMKGKIVIAITCKKLTHASLHGATQMTVAKQQVPKFTGSVHGASLLTLEDLACTDSDLEVQGASSISAKGSCDNLTAQVHGSSSLKASSFDCKSAKVQVHGSSNAHVRVSQSLNAEAHGASSIRYVGSPTNFKGKATGASSIKAAP